MKVVWKPVSLGQVKFQSKIPVNQTEVKLNLSHYQSTSQKCQKLCLNQFSEIFKNLKF
jgi:hypothetical protein